MIKFLPQNDVFRIISLLPQIVMDLDNDWGELLVFTCLFCTARRHRSRQLADVSQARCLLRAVGARSWCTIVEQAPTLQPGGLTLTRIFCVLPARERTALDSIFSCSALGHAVNAADLRRQANPLAFSPPTQDTWATCTPRSDIV